MPNLPWPPSPDLLRPATGGGADSRDPAAVTRMQHLELGDDHVRIFEAWNRLGRSLARDDSPPGGPAPVSIVAPLRAFIEHLWRHTLGEEKLFDRVLGSDR